ncbi:MAG: hypothetical protein AAB585_01560 [Patescibacteria group bacterium]
MVTRGVSPAFKPETIRTKLKTQQGNEQKSDHGDDGQKGDND